MATKVTRTQNGAPIGQISPEEAAVIRSSVASKEIAPSSRQQAVFQNWREAADVLGSPFEVERIPVSKLRAMRRDPMLGFGLSFIKTPHARAKWYTNAKSPKGPNAQVAAHLDHDLRRIYASFIFQAMNALDFGFQSLAKRFEFRVPSGTYIETNPDTGEREERPIWSEGNIEPLAWKPFVALRPEGVEPVWAKGTGEFDGIHYAVTTEGGTPPPGTGAKAQRDDNGEITAYNIDLYHSLWFTNEKEQNFGCSPYDEPVLTTNGWKLIGELDPEVDRLVTYDRRKNKIARREYREIGGKFEVGHRPYSGNLITISAGDHATRVTPNHKLTVRWTPEAENYWAVYLMRKGDWWRIGVTKLHKQHGHACSGVGNRMTVEQADDAWIVSLHESKWDALFAETLLSNQYGIPDITFLAANGVLTTEDLEAIWSKLDSAGPAQRLLRDRNLDPGLPFYTRNADINKRERATQAGMRTRWTIFAANLLPGVMEVPTDPGDGDDPVWTSFEISHEYFDGDVYSLEVPPSHHYVSNGVITQNSIFGYPRLGYALRYWWSYWLRWTIADRAFERKGDPSVIVRHPEGEFLNEETGERMDYGEYALLMGERMRSGGVIAIPSEVWEDATGKGTVRQWEIEFTKEAVNFDPFDKSFDYLDVQKLRSLFIPEQAFLEGKGGTSSRNVAAELGESFIEQQAVLSAQIIEHVNRFVIPQWLAVNYPEFTQEGGTAEIVMQGFADEDVTFTNQVVQLIGQQESGMKEILKLVDLKRLLLARGTPIADFAEQQRREAQIAADEAAAAPPAIEPTPGAGVGIIPTATGFAYIQPREVIHLSDSGADFISNLPASPHYEDRAIKGFARQLWNLYRELYRDEYRTAIEAIEDFEGSFDDEEDSVELAAGEQHIRRAARLISGWSGSRRWPNVLERTLDIMERLARRATRIELKRVNLSTPADQSDLNDWIREHIAEFATKVAETTRTEVRDFVAARLADGVTDREEIVRLARVHFDEFPDWKADRLVRTEVRDVYNAATLFAARAAGVDRVQASDGQDAQNADTDCLDRDGRIFSVDDALRELEHPNGTLAWRILPAANLSIERVEVEEGDPIGRYDPGTETIYLSSEATDEQERDYLNLIGDFLRANA